MGGPVLISEKALPNSSVSPCGLTTPPFVKNDTAVVWGTGLPKRSPTMAATGQIIPCVTKPAIFLKEGATPKCAPDGDPPAILTLVEVLVRVIAPMVMLAWTRTGPDTVPLVRTVEATPAVVPTCTGSSVSPRPRH